MSLLCIEARYTWNFIHTVAVIGRKSAVFLAPYLYLGLSSKYIPSPVHHPLRPSNLLHASLSMPAAMEYRNRDASPNMPAAMEYHNRDALPSVPAAMEYLNHDASPRMPAAME
eukprot:1161871-Pelagomonas_calceolata.AAC.8